MEHFSHPHKLILRDSHHFKEGDHCHGCDEGLILCRKPVYTCRSIIDHTSTSKAAENGDCASFFLHKNCAHLPSTITCPTHQEHDLCLTSVKPISKYAFPNYCKKCCKDLRYFTYYCPYEKFDLCTKCAIHSQDNTGLDQTTIQHWSHRHSLRFVARDATFYCDGCNKVSTDSSYMCIDERCPFWIHKTCADLPQLYTYILHHKHPVTIASSLPKAYLRFRQYCKICKKELDRFKLWVYYCANCRFFAHIGCILSTPEQRDEGGFDDPKLMHLPAADETSMNFMMQKRIKDIISVSVDTVAAPPDHINHWGHQGHQLERKNKNNIIATSDHHENNQLTLMMICNGCTKPISFSSDDADVFYGCNQCKYVLHRYCAQFPLKMMQHPTLGNYKGYKCASSSANDIFECNTCSLYSNGLSMVGKENNILLDIWCACLPEEIKHRAHQHPLKLCTTSSFHPCAACRDIIGLVRRVIFGCESCDFYIHVKCAVRPVTIVHRWDPHPLRLVLSLEDDLENHPHDFECEYCSKNINTNQWFYHCGVCDLSFHMYCVNPHDIYSNVKYFEATDIRTAAAHQPLVLKKKKRNSLFGRTVGNKIKPLLGSTGTDDIRGCRIPECKLCNYILHYIERRK